MANVEVYPVGTKVKISESELEGFITQIYIGQNAAISYGVGYFCDGQYFNETFEWFQLDFLSTEKIRLGFQ